MNHWIEEFEEGNVLDGVEAFQAHLVDELGQAGLGEEQWHVVSRVIAHPDNREGGLLVPIDVQDLLKQLVHNRWNWKRVDACEAELPEDPAERKLGPRSSWMSSCKPTGCWQSRNK